MQPDYRDWTNSPPAWASPADRNRAWRGFTWNPRLERWTIRDREATEGFVRELEAVARDVAGRVEGKTGLDPNLIAMRSYMGACERVAAEARRALEGK